jgi:hypothetical protein
MQLTLQVHTMWLCSSSSSGCQGLAEQQYCYSRQSALQQVHNSSITGSSSACSSKQAAEAAQQQVVCTMHLLAGWGSNWQRTRGRPQTDKQLPAHGRYMLVRS